MKIKELRERLVIDLCLSLLDDYIGYLNLEEIKITKEILEKMKNNTININEAQAVLLPLVNKIWNIELESGDYRVISWNKYNKEQPQKIVTFATLSKKDDIITFFNMNNGIEYEITSTSLLAALNKDGATLIEDMSKKNEYTVATIKDKVINSYNGATKFITPKILVKKRIIEYPSKHNELILDTRYIKKINDFDY